MLALALAPRPALAAVTGSIEGTVTDQATGKRLAGVTVTVTSPALQGEQTEFTDADGHYIITELPPGEYLVRFYFSNINVERPGVFLQTDKTLSVNVAIPTQKAEVKTYRITEKAPTVDVGNTQQQTTVTNEFVRNTPVRGRTYDAVLTLAPGAATDAVGFSFNGATGPENNFLIDGVNTTDPAFGLLGTQLTLEFIGETEVITGGYNAEYGRATGGVVNVITKSGSNNFHGDLWFYATPFQLDPQLIGRSGEAIASKVKTKYGFDFGFDLGGPIVKDKIWFYVGFQPTFTTVQSDRYLRARSAMNIPGTMMTGTYQGDLDPSATCPKGLDKTFCNTPGLLAPGYITNVLDSSFTRHFQTDTRLYNWIAKLNFQLNQNNSLVLQYIGSPSTSNGPIFGGFNGADTTRNGSSFENTHDASLHFVSKLADRRLQLDVIAGYHYDDITNTPAAGGEAQGAFYQPVESLALFEPEVTPCAPQTLNGMVKFNPCPVQNYRVGGIAFLDHTTVQRISAAASATYFARLGGTHALKLGFDFEDNIFSHKRNYTGGAYYRVNTDGSIEIYREYAEKSPDANTNPNGPGIALPDTGFNSTEKTLNYGAYLRDSYNVGFIPGLTLNAGVRWEAQQVQGADGSTQIGIYDNWAPRVGAIYDFTRKGRGKIFASYGWFYESIPMDINDRSFSGEGAILAATPGGTCMPNMQGIYDLSTCKPTNMITNAGISGGTYSSVAPSLKGMYSQEVVAGIQYD
ncbi:MAG TPA: TonB-dependent receptor, partial [Polyangia bacterium]